MTTTTSSPHPWSAPLANATANAASRRYQDPTDTATARMLRDDHRSQAGTCVRCAVPWPCDTARSAA